jgi:hypothetical protein
MLQGVFLVPYHKDVMGHSHPSLNPRSRKRQWLRAKDNRYKMETKTPSFSCIFSLSQVRSWCLSAKAAEAALNSHAGSYITFMIILCVLGGAISSICSNNTF